ncbi:GIY-YIG nuclease family protein [Candidatus Microgenomates bacterium]|nr:GIY-YIG nuclease family protein [Candidatus Microgenomates bacterium]
MPFYYAYVLANHRKNFLYIGFTTDLRSRFDSHNLGKIRSTRSYRPLKLIHYEAYAEKSDAKRREKYLKSNRGRTTLMTMLKDYFKNRG